MTSCQLPEEDHEIWSQRCAAYETFSILVPDNDLNLLELLILLLDRYFLTQIQLFYDMAFRKISCQLHSR